MNCSDWIQLGQLGITGAVGWIGTVFIKKQNEIIAEQTEIFRKQNELMGGTKELNETLLRRELLAEQTEFLKEFVVLIGLRELKGDALDKELADLIEEAPLSRLKALGVEYSNNSSIYHPQVVFEALDASRDRIVSKKALAAQSKIKEEINS